MRPLPQSKSHGVIHTVNVSHENVERIADQLGVPKQDARWIRPGDQLHIVREADESELNRAKK